ncbi:conserved hypothetical protein [Mycobacterium tuberculosis GM 1503]|nr:conserved hypothetical protein [Mycobacterium tuberculosis GM 1503]
MDHLDSGQKGPRAIRGGGHAASRNRTSRTSPSAISANLNGCIQHGQLPTTTPTNVTARYKSFAHPATSLTGVRHLSARPSPPPWDVASNAASGPIHRRNRASSPGRRVAPRP